MKDDRSQCVFELFRVKPGSEAFKEFTLRKNGCVCQWGSVTVKSGVFPIAEMIFRSTEGEITRKVGEGSGRRQMELFRNSLIIVLLVK